MQPLIASPEELLARILSDKNIQLDEAELFLRPRYELANPFLFAQMEEVVLRIFSAIEAKEAIGIYADYDCDGIPGAVIMADFFKKIGYEHFHIYIPDRHDEGYGMKETGIDELTRSGVKLIITVDLGITAHAAVTYALAKGIEIIITDHHAPLETYPGAYAVIHPLHGEYPNREACGAAVAFHLIRAFLKKYREYFSVSADWEKWLLDMVGFATLSDMVPLMGENRTLAKYGLLVMRKSKRIGLRALLRHLKIMQATVTEDDLTFMVAPRLNAASRMDSPLHAFELLATDDLNRAQELVAHLSHINNERKTLVATTVREAEQKLKQREVLCEVLVVGDPKWHPPILGLVAAKLQEAHGKTVFVWGRNGGDEIKGSCRSNGTHNVAVLMQKTAEHFMHFGGHAMAGGFSVTNESVHFLEDMLNKFCTEAAHAASQHAVPYETDLSVVNKKFWDVIEACAPFGSGNEKILFEFKQVTVTTIKLFGKAKEHLELKLADSTGNTATAISFFTTPADFPEPLVPGLVATFMGSLDRVQGPYGNGIRIRLAK